MHETSALHVHDEAAVADLAAVCEGRDLSRADVAWLSRAVTGAVRPNRDRPLWSMAHALHALRQLHDAAALFDIVLDPTLARPERLRDRLALPADPPADPSQAEGVHADARGLVHGEFQATWAGLARSLALAEFVATADGLARFRDLLAALDGLHTADDVTRLVSDLASWMRSWRLAHMPVAASEKRFRAILAHLGPDGHADDGAILDFWRGRAGEEVLFTTAVDHFVTYERTRTALADLGGIGDAASLDGIENWEDRLEAITLPPVPEREVAAAMETLGAQDADAPKILTGRERAQLAQTVRFDPFQRTRPLTALRAASFGAVQSGIANRMRRGTGGAAVAERIDCADAEPYAAVTKRTERLADHLRRCVTLALALRTDDADGMRELSRMRRQGLDAPPDALRPHFAAVDGSLATMLEEADAFAAATRAVPETAFAADRQTFAAAFASIYGHEREDA